MFYSTAFRPGGWRFIDIREFFRMMLCLLILSPLLLANFAYADICPKKGETIVPTRYELSRNCMATTLMLKGELNPDIYEGCLGEMPYAGEHAYYLDQDGAWQELPSVPSLLPAGDDFRIRVWAAGRTENIACGGDGIVSVTYWAGGNCAECEHVVNYRFAPDGKLQSAELK
ncbi:hypothetical protein GPA19_23710 [Azoarcus indigens]|uniref:hypothetical protein n=1 Tax=Azoarcus indigens TaxID=29545 RepID=UPI00105BF8FF|nr:hypothetical protein [Azoarcus indigens]NMG67953.1 hypothetical protein [Azoarcus indigens]